MDIDIENLKGLVYLKDLNNYQKSLAIGEFEKLLRYVNKIEQLTLTSVGRTLGCSFVLDPTTSSATKCICGKDKWEHEQAT